MVGLAGREAPGQVGLGVGVEADGHAPAVRRARAPPRRRSAPCRRSRWRGRTGRRAAPRRRPRRPCRRRRRRHDADAAVAALRVSAGIVRRVGPWLQHSGVAGLERRQPRRTRAMLMTKNRTHEGDQHAPASPSSRRRRRSNAARSSGVIGTAHGGGHPSASRSTASAMNSSEQIEERVAEAPSGRRVVGQAAAGLVLPVARAPPRHGAGTRRRAARRRRHRPSRRSRAATAAASAAPAAACRSGSAAGSPWRHATTGSIGTPARW